MSMRDLYRAKKNGKYRCVVCLFKTFSASSKKEMESHMQVAHPRTAVAWVCRFESPEKLPQGDDEDDDDPCDSDSDYDYDAPEDVSLHSFTHKEFMKMNMGRINCASLEDALNRIKSISQMPRQHFITCFFPCMVGRSLSIAVEQYNWTFSYPTKGHRRDAIRHVIDNFIQLEWGGIVGNLNSQSLVDVYNVPKYTSLPVEFISFNDFRSKVDIQNHQLCRCVDLIVGDGTQDPAYKVFRSRLLDAKTIVDLCSMLLCPYLTPSRQQPLYFFFCRLLAHYKKIDRGTFDKTIEDLRKEWISIVGSTSQDQVSWQERLKKSGHTDLIQMFQTRFGWDDNQIEYNDTQFSKQVTVPVPTLEDMHVIVEGLFRDYPTEIWENMHIGGLNAYFGPEEYAYGLLSLVTKLTNRSDKNFCFSLLLHALKMCCIMLARFYNRHEKTFGDTLPFLQELQVAASEMERCINMKIMPSEVRFENITTLSRFGLQSSNEEIHNCLLIRISAYTLKGVDILLFKSIRIIVFALQFLRLLVGTGRKGIGFCITTAFDDTKTFMSNFSTSNEFQMQILSPRYWALNSALNLPSYEDTCKIVGLNFVISSAGRLSFSTKIDEELEKLRNMLAEDN